MPTAPPIAGTCDDVTPAMILATAFLSLAGRFRSGSRFDLVRLELARSAAIAFDRAAAAQHQVGVVLLGRAGHQRREMLERMAVGRAELSGEIDVAAALEHPVVLAFEDGLALVRRQRT